MKKIKYLLILINIILIQVATAQPVQEFQKKVRFLDVPKYNIDSNLNKPIKTLLIDKYGNVIYTPYIESGGSGGSGESEGSFQWITNGSNIYYNIGNVGIGTSTPTVALDVRGLFAQKYGTNDLVSDFVTLRVDNPNSLEFLGVSGTGTDNFGRLSVSLSPEGGYQFSSVDNESDNWSTETGLKGDIQKTAISANDDNANITHSVQGLSGTTVANQTPTAFTYNGGNVGIGTSTPSVALEVNGKAIINDDTNVNGLFKVEKGIDDGISNYSTLQTNNYGLYFKGINGSDDSDFGASLLISNPEKGFISFIENADNTDYSNIINHKDKIELGITTNDTKGSIESKVTNTNIPEFTIVTQKSNLFKIESPTAGSIQYNLRNNDDTYWSVTNNDPNSFNRTIYNGDENITSLESHTAFNWTIGRNAIPLLDVDTRNLKVTIGDVTNIANNTKIIINDVTQDVTVNATTFSTSGDFTSAGTISSANINATNNIYGFTLTGNSIQSYGSIVANSTVVGTNVSPTNLTDIAAKVSKGVNNFTTTVLSSTTLNSTYTTATTGFKVYCTSIIAGAMTYEKTPTGWIGYTVFVP